MSKVSIGLVSVALSIMILSAGVCMGDINPIAPELEVIEGNRRVIINWRDLDPEALVLIHQPVLGSTQFPWNGNATLTSQGFYTGACDWTYVVIVTALQDTMMFSWSEIANWETQATRSRRISVTETDHVYGLSDGIHISVPSDGLFEPDFTGWNGPEPGFHGVYAKTVAADSAGAGIVFNFVCTAGGELTAGGGSVAFDWNNSVEDAGSFVVSRSDMPVDVHKRFKVEFGAGTYETGESFSVELMVPFVSGERFNVAAETFDGYMVLRHSVEDRPASGGDGIGQYKVVANVSKCDTFALFLDPGGEPDPYGTRQFIDEGIVAGQPGVTPDPEVQTVLNGFPYDYAVVTYDWTSDHQQTMSEIVWQRVFPSLPPASSVSGIYVVPNPYVGRAGWETGGEAKIQFMNVPGSAKIRIYDAAGGYINTVHPRRYSYDESMPQGTADWNLRDSDGEEVVSGIYIYRIESDTGSDTGRFIVVR
jgi:hypothetical protein